MRAHGSANLTIGIEKLSATQRLGKSDRVAVEEPLEIQLSARNATGAAAKSLSITMRTPGHDPELALGFLIGESLIATPNDVVAVDTVGDTQNVVRIQLRDDADIDLAALERHFYTTSSCGVCGKTSLDALSTANARPYRGDFRIERSKLFALPDILRQQQHVFGLTGGLHAAGAFDAEGSLQLVREDVGRHNAADKVVGSLLQENQLPAKHRGMLVSGRASFELLQKTLMAGMPMLAAVSAPSSLAIDLAERFNMTLVGFLRNDQCNIYCGAERIVD